MPVERIPVEAIPTMMPEDSVEPESMPSPAETPASASSDTPMGPSLPRQRRSFQAKSENPFRLGVATSQPKHLPAPPVATASPDLSSSQRLPVHGVQLDNPFRTATLTDEAVLR